MPLYCDDCGEYLSVNKNHENYHETNNEYFCNSKICGKRLFCKTCFEVEKQTCPICSNNLVPYEYTYDHFCTNKKKHCEWGDCEETICCSMNPSFENNWSEYVEWEEDDGTSNSGYLCPRHIGKVEWE